MTWWGWFIIAILFALIMAGCAPLIIGGVAGYVVEKHEARRDRCLRYFGNPDCRPGYGEHHQFPLGVHR